MTIQNLLKRISMMIAIGFTIVSVSSGAVFAEQYMNKGDGTVLDMYTNLTWVASPGVMPELASPLTWEEADAACNELIYAGLGPNVWRLPTISELQSLYNDRFSNPAIDTGYFQGEGAAYWSSTPFRPGAKAWTMNFKTGYLGAFAKNNPDKPATNYTRCATIVR